MKFPACRPVSPRFLFARLPVLALAALLTGCGGGGGGGDDSEDDFFNVLAFYDYAISNPAGAPAPFTKTVKAPGQPDDVYVVNAGTGTVRGRYFTNDGDLTVAGTTTYSVDWRQGGPAPSGFAIGFTSEASLPANRALPISGSFAITWGTDTITVDYAPDGVDVALNGGIPVTFTAPEFLVLDLPASVATDWQRVAARASRALNDLLVQARAVPVFLERVNAGELDSGQSATACTTIPGSPPAGIIQAGELVSVELGGGDRYRTTFTDCFSRSGSQATIGFLGTGTVDRNNLVTTVNGGSQGGALVEFGFVAPGGISLDTLLRVLEESSPGVWTFNGNETAVNGGFSILYTYPD